MKNWIIIAALFAIAFAIWQQQTPKTTTRVRVYFENEQGESTILFLKDEGKISYAHDGTYQNLKLRKGAEETGMLTKSVEAYGVYEYELILPKEELERAMPSENWTAQTFHFVFFNTTFDSVDTSIIVVLRYENGQLMADIRYCYMKENKAVYGTGEYLNQTESFGFGLEI